MKKVIMFGAAGLLSLSLLTGMADCTTAEAKAKSHRCSIMKGCRVTGKHHTTKLRRSVVSLETVYEMPAGTPHCAGSGLCRPISADGDGGIRLDPAAGFLCKHRRQSVH